MGDGHARAPDRLHDLGSAGERTALAWRRTALALIVVGALFIRVGDYPLNDARHLPGFAVIALGGALLWKAPRRTASGDPGPVHSLTARLVMALCLATMALSVACLALIVRG